MIKYFIIPFTACLFYSCIQESTNRVTTESLKELREKSQESLNSTINEINLKNSIYRYADSISNIDTTSKGLIKLDSLILLYPKDDKFYLYRGIWFYNKKEYHKSLSEYNLVEKTAGYSYPVLEDKKAQVYIKLNKLNEAINLYRAASRVNQFYYQKLGCAFLLNKTIDSASYYYSLYLQTYPDDIKIKNRLDSLNKFLALINN